ncbi:MAG: divalent-cation tolerance protein CutA [Bryobacteraceae bacterium]
MTDKIVLLSTCASEEEAGKIAQALVESRVAACVTVIPGARSVYRWQGAVESATEWVLIIKSSRLLFGQLRATLEKLHSYEVPELVAMQIVEGAPNYMNWLEGQIGG